MAWPAIHKLFDFLPPPSLLVDNNCRIAGTKQMGARGEAQGIRWYGGLHGQNSARGKFRTSPRKMRGKFRTKLKYGIFPAEKSPRGISPPPVGARVSARVGVGLSVSAGVRAKSWSAHCGRLPPIREGKKTQGQSVC